MKVSIMVLLYGHHPGLARRTLRSVEPYMGPDVELIVGMNDVSPETTMQVPRGARICAGKNIGKPMRMAEMFSMAKGEFIWWFDDDSWVQNHVALNLRLNVAKDSPESEILWGHVFFFSNPAEFWKEKTVSMADYIKGAPWYRGLDCPSGVTYADPGGNWTRNRWFFVTGGSWFARRLPLLECHWPDPAFPGRCEDIFMAEAIRQNDYSFRDIGPAGVMINDAPRRGSW